MTYLKPVLTVTAIGAGVAAMALALYVQGNRFAFTSSGPRSFEVPASMTLAAPERPLAMMPTPPLGGSEVQAPTVNVETLSALPATRPAHKALVQVRRVSPSPAVESTAPPCNPEWRSLESGPMGRQVREIC